MTRYFWTTHEVEALIRLKNENLTNREIGERLGVTREAVKSKLKTMRHAPPKPSDAFWTPERVSALRLGVENGLTSTDIAALIGCTRNTALGKMQRLKLRSLVGRRKPAPVLKLAWKQEAVIETPAGGVPIWELGAHHCRSILNDTMDTEDLRYCGGQTVRGGPWCAAHHARYCTPVPVRKSVERRYR